jgi:hypothetical protein
MPDTLSAHDAFGHWLSGFCDGESCFYLNMGRRQANSHFTLQIRADDLPILEEVRAFWGVIGHLSIQKSKGAPVAIYQISGVADLPTVVQHFERFPLRSRKARDFPPWRDAVRLHAEVSKRKPISFGKGKPVIRKWTDQAQAEYDRHRTILRTGREFREVVADVPVIPFDEGFRHWLAGFFAGEGHLGLSMPECGPRTTFQIGMRSDDLPILLLIHQFFGCGCLRYVERNSGSPQYHYQARSPRANHLTIVPFLQSYPLRAKKSAEVPLWLEASALCKKVTERGVKVIYADGRIRGTHPRWRPDELARFTFLDQALRQMHSYQG